MVSWRGLGWLTLIVMFLLSPHALARQEAGSIRGIVHDKDFDTPLGGAQVTIVETGQTVTTGDQGNYSFGQVAPGSYTLVFSKEGYVRQVSADIVVTAGRLKDVDAALSGEFTELDEFVVQDILQIGAGSEIALLELRSESSALMDSIGAELMSRAAASDAASALRLVAGASVQEGKFAVIRGLPDRYVSSQMNGVRLPTADEDKRAVELDQFPAAVIESIQVSKTFTPEQQGDASGGAVDIRLKGIPDKTILQFKAQTSYNTNVTGESDFLTYDGGGVDFLGFDDGDRDQQTENIGGNWKGAVGTSEDEAPIDYKLGLDLGGVRELGDDVKVGGFASLFYERDSSFYDDGIDDSHWVPFPGAPFQPETSQGFPEPGGGGSYLTSLFDVTQGTQLVQWGGLSTLGIESENNLLALTVLYTRTAEDVATLAIDTRGKEHFFPGYDPDDPNAPGNAQENRMAAPYLRAETLEYTERSTGTLQLHGQHTLPLDGFELSDNFKFKAPELDWTVAGSFADLDQPDKRQFGAAWLAPSFNPGSGEVDPGLWIPFKPSANFTQGNLQRTWKEIEEDSRQYFLNLRFPFEQWSEKEGYLQTGWFDDDLDRSFDQDSFSNFSDVGAEFEGDFDEPWSEVFPFEDHAIEESFEDVDYEGEQDITSWYTMMALPLSEPLSVIGGLRFETTELSVVNDPESGARWFPPGATSPEGLEPGEADVSIEQDDTLPAIGLVYEPIERVTLRGSYSETIARQTFKEITPILQQEYLGGPVFIGNPQLEMSDLENYDLRLDYTPYEGGLYSISWFDKDVDGPIEYVQKLGTFTYTSPENYPEGELSGFELEGRQHLGRFWERLEGLSVGANATFIDSEVTVPEGQALEFERLGVPLTTRDMTNAPDHLYNVYLTYDIERSGTQLGLFYTVEGDTLTAGAGTVGNTFVPSVYSKEYGTLNMSLFQKVGKHFVLRFQAKNLTNPEIEQVYRSEFIGDDVTRTSYTKGVEFELGFSLNF